MNQLNQVNQTETIKCFNEIIELKVEATPDSTAIICQDKQLTYKQLNQKVNQLANYLKKQGVVPEQRVGICAERSLDIVIGILGIIKAGGAYISLDPAYPQDRISFMFEDTQIPILLTQNHLKKHLPPTNIQTIYLDTDWEKIAQESTENPETQLTPDNLAYIIYTSGSTGKPKGVEITHSNISYYLEAIAKVLPITENDTYLHSASFSFSSSIRHLMLPLYQGAKIVIATKEQTKNPLKLFQLIAQENATVLDTVASVWRYGIQALESLDLEGKNLIKNSQLRVLVFSGGLLPCKLLKKVRSQFDRQPQIFNIYGQTETLGVCAYPIPPDFDREEGYVPVGKIYPHNQIYIVDENLQQVAFGESGELCISGNNLPRGYLNRPEKNAEKFIINPFKPNTSERLFRSADVARKLPESEGNMEVLGRLDFQVKIRGMRVETGEIESKLEEYSLIKEAVVSAKENPDGETQLVAYIVPKPGENLDDKTALYSELRDSLKEKLPDYMIPTTFMVLSALPLTPNGKLDRLALPKPTPEIDRSQKFVAPRDSLEKELIGIWERALDVKYIGIQDNFFALGGHSLRAVKLLNEIEQKYNKVLPLAIFFEAPNVEKLAEILRKQETENIWSPLIAIQPEGSKPPLFISHGILGNVMNFKDLAAYLGKDQPVYGIQAQGLDGQETPLSSLEEMAARNIKLIKTVQPEGPYFLGGFSFGGLVSFEMSQQLLKAGEKVAFLALFDTYSPFARQRVQTPPSNLGEKLNFHWEGFAKKGVNYLLDKVKMRLKINGKAPKKFKNLPLSSSVIQASRKIREASRLAKQKYTIQPYSGKVTLFRAFKQRPLDEGWILEPLFGWGKLAEAGVEVYDVPGGHGSLLLEPHVSVLAENVKACLKDGMK
ncbi:MAG: amino acid adenylation domain-containing protein [Okeania sp. SIO3I5]|uniref:non-ribosomal peptide synthetase n=1 Tax=Okeania sp. SIO3I5 TaxID=2607805 RepID=UPI0013BABE82|nr:amino acid adenylation domain-containing protein [Okeania sp. SIO3I5]NEQ36343.1 amino acid adenylation domain-containing protein [Okeania sp. SIO3I5]